MWISRTLYEELSRTRILAENLSSELAATRARDEERRHAGERREAALESIIADLRTQVAIKNNSFDWLSSSHERIERWYAELLAHKLEVHVPTSQIQHIHEPRMVRPVGEGVRETDDAPNSLEEHFRKNAGAIFDDVGDAVAAEQNLPTTVYEGVEPVMAQG